MIDELVEAIVPGGVWLAAGIAIGAAFGGALRPAAVRLVAVGMTAAERLQEAGAEAYEKTQDIVAEARHERAKNGAAKSTPTGAPKSTPTAAPKSQPTSAPRRVAPSE